MKALPLLMLRHPVLVYEIYDLRSYEAYDYDDP